MSNPHTAQLRKIADRMLAATERYYLDEAQIDQLALDGMALRDESDAIDELLRPRTAREREPRPGRVARLIRRWTARFG